MSRERLERPAFWSGVRRATIAPTGHVYYVLVFEKLVWMTKYGPKPTTGVEPATTWLRAMRSTDWATPALYAARVHSLCLGAKHMLGWKVIVGVY